MPILYLGLPAPLYRWPGKLCRCTGCKRTTLNEVAEDEVKLLKKLNARARIRSRRRRGVCKTRIAELLQQCDSADLFLTGGCDWHNVRPIDSLTLLACATDQAWTGCTLCRCNRPECDGSRYHAVNED